MGILYQGEQSSPPSAPSSGYVALYFKSDGLLYWKDDAGNEYAPVYSGGSATFVDLTVTGNTIIGNAIGDTLTVNAGAWALGNAVTVTGTFANLGTVTTVDINGGTIDGTVIGGTTPAAGTFTTLAATGAVSINGATDALSFTEPTANSARNNITLRAKDSVGTASSVYFGQNIYNTDASLEIFGGFATHIGIGGNPNIANVTGTGLAVTGTLSTTGVATFAAGTVALPSITTSGDTNTGVYFPAADTIAFTEGGAEAMRINSSGTVLIGTTSATGSNLLQVNSDIRVNGFTLGKGASSVATNTGFGLSVFSAITTGAQNTAFGYGAMSTDTTGFGNSAFGLSALNFNNGGSYNTALGHSTLYYSTTGTQNTAVGHACMSAGLTTGVFNTGVGYTAVQMCTTGVATLGAITGGTGYTNGTYPGVVMTLSSGSAAATYPTATIVVAGGVVTTVTITSAGTRFVDTTTVLTAPAASIGGTGSGFSVPVATLIYGSGNTGVGHQAILFTTVGGSNTAVGYQAGRQNTTGNGNTSFGSGAGYTGVTASNNTSIGYSALQLATGGSNIGLGYNSGGAITTGTGNVVIGAYTGSTAPISTTGSNSIVISDGAGNVREYYDGTNNAWVFNTGATERMRIDSSGNVGIGTASPSSKLGIKQSGANWYDGVKIIRSTIDTQLLAFGNTSGASFIASVDSAGGSNNALLFGRSTDGTTFTESMRLEPLGNLDIGTTSSKVTQFGGSATGITLAGASYPVLSLWDTADASYNFMLAQDGGTAYLVNYANGPMTFSTNNTEKMRIDSSGNVGIGTASPSIVNPYASVVDIRGTTTDQNYGGAIRLASNNGTSANSYITVSTNGLAIYNTIAHPIIFGTNNTEKMRIDSSGNVGIGATANASAILDAQSTTKGVRMPNMTTTQKNAIATPAAGLMVYDTTLAKLCVYTTAWETITSV